MEKAAQVDVRDVIVWEGHIPPGLAKRGTNTRDSQKQTMNVVLAQQLLLPSINISQSDVYQVSKAEPAEDTESTEKDMTCV